MTNITEFAKQLKNAADYLAEHKDEGGCYHFNKTTIKNNNLFIVLGWADGWDEETDNDKYCDDGYRLCVKVGYQDVNNMMQCDYAVDFDEPWDKATGDTCGGEIAIYDGCNFESIAKEILESFQWVKDNWNKLGHN